MKAAFSSLLLALIALAPLSLAAQTKPPIQTRSPRPQQDDAAQPVAKELRVALVIGNSAYSDAPLKNPVNDARAMKVALEGCKFEVTLLMDASKRTMEDAIRAFGDRIRGGAVGLFYFAGHGVQVKGVNYLVPVGALMDREDEVPYQAVEAGQILDKMDAAKNRLNILILDACRNNPFARSWRSSGDKGLAQVKAPTGSLIAYATAPGSTAADGSGEHGLYTEALLTQMKEPGQELEKVFKKVREKVLAASGNQQTPWESNSTVGDFYFRPLATNLSGPSEAELEATYWEGVQHSRDAKEFDAFLTHFPSGAHAELARLKLKALRSASAPLVVNNLAEPWKAFQRDKLETKEDYATRIAALGPIKVGTALVSLDNYTVDTKRMVLSIQAEEWAKPHLRQERMVLELDRDQVRQLMTAGANATVAARFEVKGDRVEPGPLVLSTPIGSFTPGPEPPPLVGAVKNTEGNWEAEMDLGRCRMRMILIPAGSFSMGSNNGNSDEKPAHSVTITKDFWLGKYEVTQGHWQAVMGSNPFRFKGDALPVDPVSWDDAQAFLEAVNAIHKGFRLPTEAEWEYACRAGRAGETYGSLDTIAWHNGNSGGTPHPVGQKQPNAFGLHDMLGNTWEWCQDYVGDYQAIPSTDPQGPSYGYSSHVMRGGSWGTVPSHCTSLYRGGNAKNFRNDGFGFRVVVVAGSEAASSVTPVPTPEQHPEARGDGTATNQELAKLQGTWRTVAMENDGVRKPTNPNKNDVVVIRDDSFIARSEHRPEEKMTLKIVAPAACPKTMDIIVPLAGVYHGIYELDGDTLKICIHQTMGETSDKRPSTFATSPGSGFTLITLKRVGKE